MLILSSDQVEYCQVIRKVQEQEEIVPGLLYKDKLFLKQASYDIDDQEKALQLCRQKFLDNKPPILSLIIEEQEDLGVWIEDPSLKLAPQSSPQLSPQKEVKQEPQTTLFNLTEIALKMQGEKGVDIKTRWQNFKPHENSFLGSEAVNWLANEFDISREEGVKLAQQMLDRKIIQGITDPKKFSDRKLLYRFRQN